ncbi:MAG: HAMP domain-containing protein [Actinobacteria bacterium]|nr:MAG: HAMP domain-containing protein [Actinomycetota bacterium]
MCHDRERNENSDSEQQQPFHEPIPSEWSSPSCVATPGATLRSPGHSPPAPLLSGGAFDTKSPYPRRDRPKRLTSSVSAGRIDSTPSTSNISGRDPMSSNATVPVPPIPPDQPRDDLGPLPRIARPFVDWVARIRATVHTKLLAGFLVIALLLLSMGVLCIVVLDRVNRQVETLTALNRQTDQAREMIYEVTAQSHYRAMALLTGDQSWTGKIDQAKDLFVQNLAELRTYAVPDRTAFFDDLQAANDRFTLMSSHVTALDEAGERAQAIDMHIDFEHTQSHVLENALNSLIADSQQRAITETAAFASHRRFLTLAVATFSGITLLGALVLGAILSWSLIRPVRRVDWALDRIANGDFKTRVSVPNRTARQSSWQRCTPRSRPSTPVCRPPSIRRSRSWSAPRASSATSRRNSPSPSCRASATSP